MIKNDITNEDKAKLTVNVIVSLQENLLKLQENFLISHKALNKDIQYLKSAMLLINGACILLGVIIALIVVGLGMGLI